MPNDPLARYDFEFPREQIAKKPAKPRDSANLLVYDRGRKRVAWDTFKNLPVHLPARSVLVFNKTKVIPARLEVRKESGGRVRLLYVRSEKKSLVFLADRALAVGATVRLANTISFTVEEHRGQFYYLAPSFPPANIFKVLDRYGVTPIPPYIKDSPLTERSLRREYQAVFAKEKGSVAAPTASLHFTPGLLQKLRRAGHEISFVTLHVNLGTFAPLTPRELKEGKLHAEWYQIDPHTAERLNKAKQKGRPIIAVGTTVLRTLESASDAQGLLKDLQGETRLFIKPGYRFRFVRHLVTNFHVPRSSLLMLVAAFIPRSRLLKLYEEAIRRDFRLFSFGDGMLIK